MILMMTVAEGGGEKVMMGMMSVSGERSNFYLPYTADPKRYKMSKSSKSGEI